MHSRQATVLVTGASSGIGKACAMQLAERGFRVYGTSRAPQRMDVIVTHNGGFLKMIPLDVTNDDSVTRAIECVMQSEETLDIVINAAGFGLAGAVEDTSPAEAMAQLDTNLFGVLRVCRAVLPSMRQQRRGVIINIGSVGGFIALPFQGMYSASKYALEALTEALRMEVAAFGIDVVIVDPGDVKTGFTEARRTTAAAKTNDAYQKQFERTLGVIIQAEQAAPGPDIVAREVLNIIQKKKPPLRVVVGPSYKAIAVLKRILPDWVIEQLLRRTYRV